MNNPVAKNGKLYGTDDISDLSTMLMHLHPSCNTVCVDNEPFWQQQLCEADPQKLPFTFMNETTVRKDKSSGQALYFEIPKAQLGAV